LVVGASRQSGSTTSWCAGAGDHWVNAIAAPTSCTSTTRPTHALQPPVRQKIDGGAPPALLARKTLTE